MHRTTTPRSFRPLAVLLLGLLLAPLASAQMPTQGEFYEDSVDLGFKVRIPKGWVFAPSTPGEPNIIGTYSPPFNKYVNISPSELLPLGTHLVKFDRRPKPEEPAAVTQDEEGRVVVDASRLRQRAHETLASYVEARVYGSGAREIESGEFRLKGVEATEHLFRATADRGAEFYIWAVLYKLRPDLDIALLFTAPAGRDWRRWQGNLRRMGQTFQPVEVAGIGPVAGRVGDSAYRTKKRGELALEVARNPGWSLDETENYFIISAVQDAAFMRELKLRLEAIRSIYEELYPPEQAERMRLLARQRELERKDEPKKEPGEAGADGEDDEEELEVVYRTASDVTPQELSRCSVVRVCANREQYRQYGGHPQSAGYWYWVNEELVLFDDKAGGGRRDTWAVLNHEAFHQYIFYFYGNISPHSWYNEGTGDYFSGYQLKNNRFVLSRFDWRLRVIQQGIRENKFVPLRDLVRFTQAEYYGTNKYGLDGGSNYAQGWSLIYFLRTGKGKARGWNNAWDGILDTYLETLAATRDLDEAVETAFAGVDWAQMEESWKAYTLN